MAIESSNDLAAFFDPADFGVTVQIGGSAVNAIYEGGWAEAGGMEGTSPMLTCRSIDVAAVVRGAAVVVPGVGDFTVVSPMPDGTGITRLVLEES